jgi:hypothetical protein
MGITAVAIVSFCRGLLTRLARIAAALETLATQQEPRPR